MMTLVLRFCKTGELVLVESADTSVARKACLQLQVSCRFKGYEKYRFFEDALLSVINLYSKQICSPVSNVVGSEEVAEAGKVFAKKIAILASSMKVDNWTVSVGFVFVQALPAHII